MRGYNHIIRIVSSDDTFIMENAGGTICHREHELILVCGLSLSLNGPLGFSSPRTISCTATSA